MNTDVQPVRPKAAAEGSPKPCFCGYMARGKCNLCDTMALLGHKLCPSCDAVLGVEGHRESCMGGRSDDR